MPKRLPEKQMKDIDAIIRHEVHQDIELSDEQKKLYQRVIFTDELLRSRKYKHAEMIRLISTRFSISKWRAEQDIKDAHRLYSYTRQVSKTYMLSHHIEEIAIQIQEARAAGRLELLPKLNDNLTYALNSLPAHRDPGDTRPKKVQYVLVQNNLEKSTKEINKDIRSTIQALDQLLNAEDGDYIEFEESDGSTDPGGDN